MPEPSSSNIRSIPTLPVLAGPGFVPPTPYRNSPCPLRPVKVQLLPRHLRRLRAPLELRPNCVLTDDRAAAGDAAGRLSSRTGSHLPGGRQSRSSRRSPASAHRPPHGRPPRLAFAPPPPTPPPTTPGSGRPSSSPCVQPSRSEAVSLGRRSAAPGPPPPPPALRLQIAESRRVPAAVERGPAAQSALTWKCSAIFPGGGAGQRPREPEGRERRRVPRKPQPPAGSLRRSFARSSRVPGGLCSRRWTGRGLT